MEKIMFKPMEMHLINYVHILIPANNDYTLCGQATDEYLFDRLNDNAKVTCEKCKRFVIQCREVKL